MNTEYYYNDKIREYKELLNDIKEHEFTTVEQVIGLIHTNIDCLEKCKAAAMGEDNE